MASHSIYVAAQTPKLVSSASPGSEQMDRNRISKEYGLLPLSFEPTTVSPQAFIARTAGGTVWLDGKQLLLSLARPDTRHRQRSTGPLTVKLSLEGADPSASAKPTGELPGKTNYFTGENQSKWRTNVANFSAVECSSIYPGIDLKYYGDRAGHLEHDFLVKPGADPAVIQFNVAGADALALTSNGDIQMTLRRASAKETAILQRPIVYQEIEGRRTLVEASYTLRSANEVAFQIGPYDRSKQLVIDPVLDYSTFLGGGILTSAYAITVDGGGNAYVVGHTGADGSFPVTKGSYDPNCGGCSAAFVAKLNSSGTALIYSTYLASGNYTQANGVAVDATGAAYVAGETSADYPVTKGAFQTNYGGAFSNGFVTKLNASGSALDYSTYLGGNGPSTCYSEAVGSKADEVLAIAVDKEGDAYVTGCTSSKNFPVTKSAFEKSCGGCEANHASAFATKLNPAGSELVYSTFLGGDGLDFGYGIAVDSTGTAYVAGSTTSTNLKVTSSAYQKHLNANGGQNAFVVRLNGVGTGADYYTYLGGSVVDGAYAIAINSNGDAYVAGYASSDNFPTTPGAYQRTCHDCAGYETGFVTELNSSGSALGFSTFLGGSGFEALTGIALNANKDVFVTGITESTNFPTTGNAYKRTCSQCSVNIGRGSAIFSELNATGTALDYSTYLGGSSTDSGTALAVDSLGNAYVVGQAGSSNFPVSAAAIQQSCSACAGGDSAAFVTKFYLGTSSPSLGFSPASLNFGNQGLKETGKSQTLTIKNSGQGPLQISSIKIGGADPGDFGGSQNCGVVVPPGASCAAKVAFTPQEIGGRSATLEVADNGSGSPQSAKLSGTGVKPEPIAAFSATSVNFGDVKLDTVAEKVVTLTNTGSADLAVTAASISGSGQANFGGNTNCGSEITPGGSCAFTLAFEPTQKIAYKADLNVTTSASSKAVIIPMSGTGD